LLSTDPIAANLPDGISVALRTRLLNALCLGAASQLIMAADPIRVASSRDYTVTLNRGSDAGLAVGQHLDILSASPNAAAGSGSQYNKLAEAEIVSISPTAATCNLVMPQDVKADYLATIPALIQPGMLCRITSAQDATGAIVVPVP